MAHCSAEQSLTPEVRELSQSLPGLQDSQPVHAPGTGHAVAEKLHLSPWPASLRLKQLQGSHQCMLVLFLLWDGIPEHSNFHPAREKIDLQDKTMVQAVSTNYPKAVGFSA